MVVRAAQRHAAAVSRDVQSLFTESTHTTTQRSSSCATLGGGRSVAPDRAAVSATRVLYAGLADGLRCRRDRLGCGVPEVEPGSLTSGDRRLEMIPACLCACCT